MSELSVAALLLAWVVFVATLTAEGHIGKLYLGESDSLPKLWSEIPSRQDLSSVIDVHKARQLQASAKQVTVVILNWQRPRNVQKIIRKYVEYDSIAEVIIWMCHADTRFNYSHPKVRIIDDVDANSRFGLSTRFKACLMAKTPWVLIQDDDHYLKEKGLLKMIKAKTRYPQRLVGTFGRDWPQGEPPRYIKAPVRPGPCRIVLTILMLTDQATCEAFWKYAPLVEPYVRQHSKPLWNGEDIFFSLVSYKATGQVPLVVQVAKVFMPQQHIGIHFGGDHDTYRDDFLKYAVQALKLEYGSGGSSRSGGGSSSSSSGQSHRIVA